MRLSAAIGRLRYAWRALRAGVRVAIADQQQREQLSGVLFGSGVLLRGAERMRAGGGVFIDHRAYLSCGTLNEGRGYIHMGDNVEIGPYSVLWGGGGIEIGSNVHLGAHVHVTSQAGRRVPADQHDPRIPLAVDVSPVRIGDNVLIYSGAIVCPGVTIGHHAAVAAGAVVVDDVPPYALAAGVPARVVRAHQWHEAGTEGLKSTRGFAG
jgi:acetyltransferase-like isoleucine patch superfamily enzyme